MSVLTRTPAGARMSALQLGASFSRIPRNLFQPVEAHAFAHPAEQDLARILSFYRIRWVYEPTTFNLEFRDDGRPAEQITPDFYLPDHDLFLELTTMRQRLVTRKNRKIRRLRETFPSVHIKLLYRRDYDRLVGSFPSPDGILEPVLDDPIFEREALRTRISELASEIYESFSGPPARDRQAVHIIGVGRGSRKFRADLETELSRYCCRLDHDELALSRYDGNDDEERVHIDSIMHIPVRGADVLLVTDIVSSGLSLVAVTNWLRNQGVGRVRVCALMDREDARVIDLPLDFVGFKVPDQPLVGYGLSSYPRFGDLPYIAPIHEGSEI